MRYPDLSTLGLSARTPEIPPAKYHDWTYRAALKRALPPCGQRHCADLGPIPATFRSDGKFSL